MPLTLVDINECSEGTDGCAQNCYNTVGSYTCSCTSGYLLASDGHWCAGKFKMRTYIIKIELY